MPQVLVTKKNYTALVRQINDVDIQIGQSITLPEDEIKLLQETINSRWSPYFIKDCTNLNGMDFDGVILDDFNQWEFAPVWDSVEGMQGNYSYSMAMLEKDDSVDYFLLLNDLLDYDELDSTLPSKVSLPNNIFE